ncbi:MAG: F0F1 ATP synthase subunit A [Candidatus Cloacimonetes bacterium]|nr:F0F1 ATP synthase subunit A [Candidatus Cloacimonadota bacterium]
MTKKKLIRLFLIFLVIQAILSIGLDYKLNIGINPEKGRFAIWNTPHPMTIQDRIIEEFMPDQYVRDKGITPKIYGSEKLYNFFAYFFNDNALNAFSLLRMIFILNCILIVIALLIRQNLSRIPSKRQVLFELIHSFFENLTSETLGKKYAYFTPYVLTIFIFIWSANFIGVVPIPGFMEPTRNINVPLGMGLMVVAVVHFMAIKKKGLFPYLKGFTEPFIPLAPINVVGEFSKAISISFRLFGNVLGGAIILIVISSLVRFIILPVGLSLFFGLFIGTIQAFVFTMLAISYIAVEIYE